MLVNEAESDSEYVVLKSTKMVSFSSDSQANASSFASLDDKLFLSDMMRKKARLNR
jgi:hypothetical protein